MNPNRTEHLLTAAMSLPVEIETAFGFFGDAANLERITPPELCFRIITPSPIRIAPGTVIDYRLRLFGVPFCWKTRISVWEPPHRFVDEQLHGPYRRWLHRHTFSATGDLTTIADEVVYALPLWPVGEILHPLISWQLQRIFQFRQAATRRILLSGQE